MKISLFDLEVWERESFETFRGRTRIAVRGGAAHTRHITVCHVPTYGSNTVAEHVFGLLLTISHKLEEAIDRTRKGGFSPKGLQGFDLMGKTLGIVGTGGIGWDTVRIAKGFGMKVLAYQSACSGEREDPSSHFAG